MDPELKIVGKSVPKIGAVEKVMGTIKYTGDLVRPGMLHAKILRSPYAHARILDVDTSEAEKIEGVLALISHKDVPNILFGEDGSQDNYVLTDKARFAGDEVVAVAAETESIAEEALRKVSVEYEELPVLMTYDEALKDDAPLIPPPESSETNLLISPIRTVSKDWGDPDGGFEEADRTFEMGISMPRVQGMPLEPRTYLAEWENDKLKVTGTTGKPFTLRHEMAKVLQMPENRIHIIAPHLGGSFGSKLETVRYPLMAALLSKKTGKPVILNLTKEEDMIAVTRPNSDAYIKIGVKEDGTVKSIHGKLTVLAGGYNGCLTTACSATCLRALFRCPNVRFEAQSVYTNHCPSSQMRGVMANVMCFSMNQLVGMIAEDLGFDDSMSFIKKARIRVGDRCDTFGDTPGCTLSSCGLDECMDRGAEAIDWKSHWKGWKIPVSIDGHKRIGIGMAPIVHDSALPWMESGAVIKLNADGSADFLTPVTENGNAAITSQTQVVSEASGIPFEDINVIFGDTEATPFDFMGQVGSSTAHIRSIASKRAGEDARKQLIERASDQMGEKPENLDIENGRILLKSDQETYITIKEIMSGMLFGGVEPVVGRGTARTPHYPERAYNFGAHFSLVEVNTITGEVKILKYVAAHDVGRALNLHAVESQIQGGVLMGLGQVFTEAIIFDSKGKPRNNQYADYKIATAADYPDIEPIVVETDDPISAYGAKGFSEAPLVGVPGCVVNAIYNAIGIRFDTLPILPERVIERLKLNV